MHVAPVALALTLAALISAAPLALALAQSTDGSTLRPTPAVFVPPKLTEAQVETAVRALDGVVEDIRRETGVPGIAVTVVHDDRIRVARGYGLRNQTLPDPVDADTVFQLASVSKPITSTVIAGLVGRGTVAWDDRLRPHLPGFALSDPFAGAETTLADMLSHRSGLYTSSGDLLEDLGYDRAYILDRLRFQPLDRFRASYNYTNFGFTAAAQAAAAAAGLSWEELADQTLFAPLGMTRSSFRYADFARHENRAALHVRSAGSATSGWVQRPDRRADPQAPAGGASASVSDLAKFLRLQLAGGKVDGGTGSGDGVIDATALADTHVPHMLRTPPRHPLGRAEFYGFGWNVSYDDQGRLEISHSGGFYMGAATHVALLPGEGLAIGVLTNGEPIGVPEAIARIFLDIAVNGRRTVDWLPLFAGGFEAMRAQERAAFDYGAPLADPRPPLPLTAYEGAYDNHYYGPIEVRAQGGELVLSMGPAGSRRTFGLRPRDGDTFVFTPPGENATPQAGARFERSPRGEIGRVVLDYYNQTGLGSFIRAAE